MTDSFFTRPTFDQALGADGFDGANQFQMIPLGGTRSMVCMGNPTQDVLVSSEDPNVATIGLVAVIQGQGRFQDPATFKTFLLQGNQPGGSPSMIRFPLFSGRVKFTRILVRAITGQILGWLVVSVRSRIRLSYTLSIIRDGSHRTTDAEVAAAEQKAVTIMKSVQTLYSNQANVELTQIGDPHRIKVDGFLGDPVFLNDKPTMDKLFAAISAEKLPAAVFHLFSVWDLENKLIELPKGFPKLGGQGDSITRTCFMDEVPPGPFGTTLYAHEIGHALTLDHNFSGAGARIMEAAPGPINIRFDAMEITILNPGA